MTDTLILTGGRTGGADKLSEAEAMQDVIIREFGRLFFEREVGQKVTHENKEEYHRFINDQLKPCFELEEDAPNTIGNVRNSANKFPKNFLPGKRRSINQSSYSNYQRLLI